MVGLVIVSHSAKLAESVRELAEQMTHGQVEIAAAGGVDDPAHPFGTDAIKILEAIQSVYSPAGVLVLMDMGSALLSAEAALEFLSPEQRPQVLLCAAPLVEGIMSAAVQASIGGNLQQVLAEAESSLMMKTNQLEPLQQMAAEPAAEGLSDEEAMELSLTVRNRLGIHARPAARFVKTAGQYQAEISVRKGDKSANAKSINQVVALAVRQGTQIILKASGPSAADALAALKTLVDNNFGETDDEPAVLPVVPPRRAIPVPQSPNELVGIPASPGIAIGPVFHYRLQLPEVVTRTVTNVEAEWDRLQAAMASAQAEIKSLQIQTTKQLGASEASIFEAQQMILQDTALLDVARERIFAGQINAEAAWLQTFEPAANELGDLEDEYLRERAADVLDVGQRVLRQLTGGTLPSLDLSRPAIILAQDLTPSDTARMSPASVLGICTTHGGATSHSAILARALGIPAVVGLNGIPQNMPDGQTIAIDGGTGQLWLQPAPAQLAELTTRREAWLQVQQQAKTTAQQPAVTLDGRTVEIVANIGGPFDTPVALEFGAEGVGLFRTEFLFMDRPSAPTEEEQLAAYRQVAETLGELPLVIRTLDVGGDKPLAYLDLGEESNPFLGWRGIRFCLHHPEIFKPQLRAILRASAGHSLKLMFPMVGTLAEVRAAKQVVAEIQAELRAVKIPFDEQMEVGIMIEVPSAVVIADQLAKEVDFFSIGTNDLTQYVMAADRGNNRVAGLANALHPAVLRAIQQTMQAAHNAGIWVGMCGELAGNALATPLLLGLGLDELSMSAPAIPAVKAAVRQLRQGEAQQLARHVLTLESAEEVQNYLQNKARLPA